jgi:hypothetical protein
VLRILCVVCRVPWKPWAGHISALRSKLFCPKLFWRCSMPVIRRFQRRQVMQRAVWRQVQYSDLVCSKMPLALLFCRRVFAVQSWGRATGLK